MSKKRKEMIAMLLAGGQGTRLGSLTENVAKPAVPFGGKYRIIDFTLSNSINSGIDTIGVLTQYKPFELNQYIGSGQPWDLDRVDGGAFILPPYQQATKGEWYKGTANAIYQNIEFIDRYNPYYVLVLSGDHIYKMDYSQMLKAHQEKQADCTIAVISVSIEEASRFGIMNTLEDGTIYEFEEKPKQPKSTKASMGIYIFTWEKLRTYLCLDEENAKSDNDFGKNIIPMMLADKQKMFAYEFDGYWKDVGTISSLWEANMDILSTQNGIDLEDRKFKIYARNTAEPPHYLGKGSKVNNSIISEGCNIDGEVINSVVFRGADIEHGAVVKDSIVMPEAIVKRGAVVAHSIVAWEAVVGEGAFIGETQNGPKGGEWSIAVVSPQCSVPPGVKVASGEMYKGGAR